MASIFAHAISAIAIGSAHPKPKVVTAKFWLLGILCSVFPDADVLGFQFGIAYESFWGHRGFTHSFFFAFCAALLLVFVFYANTKRFSKMWWGLVSYFFLCMASHGILDAMTTGGRGIAFFSPFENSRYFLPWRGIQVSPLGVKNFFSEWGLEVLRSEWYWVWLPSLAIIFVSFLWRIVKNRD